MSRPRSGIENGAKQRANGRMSPPPSTALSGKPGSGAPAHCELELFRTLLRHIPDRIYFKDSSARFVSVSQAMAEMFGFESPEALVGLSDHDLFRPEVATLKYEDDCAVMAGHPIYNKIEIDVTHDGETHWLSTTKLPWLDQEGRTIGLFGISREVTEQVRTEKELRETTLRFSLALKAAQIVTWDWDLRKGVIQVSSGIERQVGPLINPTPTIEEWTERIHPDDREAVLAELDAHLRGETPDFHRVLRLRHRDGSYRWVFSTGQAIDSGEGPTTRMVGCQIDVTHRKKFEMELQKAHDTTAQLLAAVPSILISSTWDGRIGLWNQAAEQIFGLPPNKAAGLRLEDCPIGWDWSKVNEGIQTCRESGESVSLSILSFKTDRGAGFLEMQISPVSDTGNGEAGFLILALDVTERKRLQDELAQSQKLQSIGQLAAGIAHEINTPTQFIGDNLRFLQDVARNLESFVELFQELREKVRRVPELELELRSVEEQIKQMDLDFLLAEMPTSIRESLEGICRISRIVSAMKEFSHPGEHGMASADLNRLIESTLTVARNEWKYVAQLQLQLDPDLPPVQCNSSEFNQALLNMIVNAAQAIRSVRESESSMGTIAVSTQVRGDFVEVRISDDGPGIPADVLPRIFDPFFTTKEVGQGTGQGLAITHSIVVDKHHGRLHCESEPGVGTTFIIQLPLTEP